MAEKDQLIGEQVTEISRLQKLLKNKDKELAETSRKIEDLEATKNKKEEEHVAEVRSFSELLEQKGNQIQTLSDALRTARGENEELRNSQSRPVTLQGILGVYFFKLTFQLIRFSNQS